MNKLFLILFASVAMIACGNKEAKHNHSKNEEKMKTVELTKAEFLTKVANYETNPSEWKYLGDKPALIDFYASWCGPCMRFGPIYEKASEANPDITFAKVDTEAEQELADTDEGLAGGGPGQALVGRPARWRRRPWGGG